MYINIILISGWEYGLYNLKRKFSLLARDDTRYGSVGHIFIFPNYSDQVCRMHF